MPHVSKHALDTETRRSIDERIVLFLIETKIGARKKIFREILTTTERVMLAKRLTLIFLITHDVPTYAICRLLKISSSTVRRFENALAKGAYAETASWMTPKNTAAKLLSILSDLAAIPFEAKRKSLRQLIDEAVNRHGT